jgi:hypothetical protein
MTPCNLAGGYKEDGGKMRLRNAGIPPPDQMMHTPWRAQYKSLLP